MSPENQQRYQEFQQTVGMLKQQKAQLETDIATVENQLTSMRQELTNLDQTITLHTGGMSTIEVLTTNGYAIVKWEDPNVPLSLNAYQVTQQAAQQAGIVANQQPPAPQAAPVQQQPQYQQQPTQQQYQPQPAITPQAQEQFAPPQQPMFGQQDPMAVPAGHVTSTPE